MAQSLGNVLVADDDVQVTSALSAWLNRQGYESHVVGTGRDALTALDELPYDLLLLDLEMPDNDDLAVVRERRGEAELVPVIILTGAATLESAILALRLGVIDYVTKPPDLDELRFRIAHAIGRGRAVRALIERERVDLATRDPRARASTGSGAGMARGNEGLNHPALSLGELSARELEVAQAVAAGHRPAAIAQRLDISPNTVRSHLKAAFRKLGVHSQLELVSRLGDLLRLSR